MSTRTISRPWDGFERRGTDQPFFGTDRRNADAPAAAKSRTRAFESYATTIFLGMLMLFVATLSVAILSKQSIRLDEAQSLWQTTGTPLQIFNMVAQDVHVPLYHLVLHYWRLTLGDGIGIARMLSLIFFLAMIPAMYHLGRVAYNRTTGMFGAFLIAVSPFLNWYGSEARMYSMLAFFTVLNQYFFLRMMKKDDRGAWIGYTITAVLGSYTHYFFAFALISQAIFYFLRQNAFPKGTFRKLVITALIVGVAISPWLLYVVHLGTASNTQPQLLKPTSVDLFNTFSQFMFGFQDDHLNTIIVSLWPLTIVLAFLGLRRNKKITPQTFYFIIAMTVPIFGAFAFSIFVRPFFIARYLILALPSLYLFLAWLLTTYPPRLSFSLKTLLIAGMVFMLAIQTTSADTPVKEDYRDATEYLNAHASPQDVVILSAPFTVYPFDYYYTGTAAVQTLPVWDRFEVGPIPAFSPDTLPQEVSEVAGTHENAWVLLSYNQGYEDQIRMYLDTHFEQVYKQTYSDDLTLYEYKLRYDTPSGSAFAPSHSQNKNAP